MLRSPASLRRRCIDILPALKGGDSGWGAQSKSELPRAQNSADEGRIRCSEPFRVGAELWAIRGISRFDKAALDGSVPPVTIKAVVHPAEEGGFWAEIPALPGCVTQGDSIPEGMANLKEAVEGWLEIRPELSPSPTRWWRLPFKPDFWSEPRQNH